MTGRSTGVWLLSMAAGISQAAAETALSDPLHFWKYESGYSGAAACTVCHSEIAQAQARSHHALSLRRAADVPELRRGLPFQITDPSRQARIRLQVSASGVTELNAVQEGNESSMSLLWAFGSGSKGITPVGLGTDGAFIESRLSWYGSTGGFDFTTGAGTREATTATLALGRGLSAQQFTECLGCHTTGHDRSGTEPDRERMGIRCERCHGPGKRHAADAPRGFPAGKLIFPPGRLGAFAQAQLCGACHGRPPRDNEFEALQYIERTPQTARFPSQRLVLSRCFNESEDRLKCTTCHNPHRNVESAPIAYDNACRSCHSLTRNALARTACPVGKSGCASCHMPRNRLMQHSVFTDHWIRPSGKQAPAL